MPQTTAILSLLHEPANHNSATRTFRNRPVLAWTVDRVSQSSITQTKILCWDDQRAAVQQAAPTAPIHSTPRTPIPALHLTTAAQRWSQGWRGGLLSTCHFDQGFHAPSIKHALTPSPGTPGEGRGEGSAARAEQLLLLINPASALIDPALIDAMIAHADDHPDLDLFFTQAAPGLAGALLRPALLDRLAQSNAHPGRLLGYHPDTPGRDPITTDMCVPVPAHLARTTHRFTLDSTRQLHRLTAAYANLNGQLLTTPADQLLTLLNDAPPTDLHPREVVLELTPRRATKPIYAASTHLNLSRGDLTLESLDTILNELRDIDDLRLTLAGAGDPLLHPQFPEILRRIDAANIPAVHVETDLVELSEEALTALASSRIDILSIHLPAAAPATYERVMGVDAYARVIENFKRLLAPRRTLPILVPTFTKCRANLDEMEPWYDHWLRVLGAAVITAPTDHAGQTPDHAAADMSPPLRRPCARLDSRLTIHSDGTIPSCEQDALARQTVAQVTQHPLKQIWQHDFAPIRRAHATNHLHNYPLCTTCKDWHRP